MTEPEDAARKREKQSLERARTAIASHRALAQNADRRKRTPWLIAAAALSLLFMYLSTEKHTAGDVGEAAAAVCGSNDSACQGRKLIAQIQAPCSRAVESLLSYQPEWAEGTFGRRFDNPAWYEPTRTIIFTGRHLLAENGFGAQRKLQYFCVVDVGSGRIVNAGLPELDTRLSP